MQKKRDILAEVAELIAEEELGVAEEVHRNNPPTTLDTKEEPAPQEQNLRIVDRVLRHRAVVRRDARPVSEQHHQWDADHNEADQRVNQGCGSARSDPRVPRRQNGRNRSGSLHARTVGERSDLRKTRACL